MSRESSPAATYTIPMAYLGAAAEAFAVRGIEPEPLLRAAGISPELLSSNRARLTTEQMTVLVRELWRVTDDEMCGLAAKPVPRGTFRLLAIALVHAADLQEALARFEEFAGVLALPDITVNAGPETSVLSVHLPPDGDPGHLLAATMLTVCHRFTSWLIGRRIRLLSVDFAYPRPDDISDLRVIFDAPLHFDAPTTSFTFLSDILSAPIMRDEDELSEYVKNSPHDLLSRREYGTQVADQVRRSLATGLRGDWPTGEEIASRLAMSPQTMRRKLGDEGTSLTEIKQELMLDTAVASLVDGSESIADLSERLGFSEPSAFRRAFRRWTGSPPGAYNPDA